MGITNVINTDNGIAIYEHDIYLYADEYIKDILNSPDRVTKRQFTGVLRYIQKKVFAVSDTDVRYNNKACNIDYADIDMLNGVLDIYTDLCCRYNQETSKNGFSNLTGITRETLDTWKKNEYRAKSDGNGEKPTSAHSDFVKKIDNFNEDSLADMMLDGNIMAYAKLKCKYDWQETPNLIRLMDQGGQPQISRDELLQIAESSGTGEIDGGMEPDF